MIELAQISGMPDTPAPTQGHLFAHTNGYVGYKHSDGTTSSSATNSLSGLVDVSGIWVANRGPVWNGTKFVPSPIAYTVPLTTVSSGLVNISVVLGSGVIPDGTSGLIIWSGIDQTYDMLEVHGEFGGKVFSATIDYVCCYFNNDMVNNNYRARRNQSLAANMTSDAFQAPYVGSHIPGYQTASANNAISIFNGADGWGLHRATTHFYIHDYAVSGRRKFVNTSSTALNYLGADFGVTTTAMQWKDPSGPPITMITLAAGAPTNVWNSGTIATLIGHKRVWVVNSGSFGSANIVNGYLVP